MTTEELTEKKPLWLLMEEKIAAFGPADFEGEKRESMIERVARDLDSTGYNVSKSGGNLLELRWAVDDMIHAGRPLMKDFDAAVSGLRLDDVVDPYAATVRIISDVGADWPKLKLAERKDDVLRIVERTKLDLLVAKAKGLEGDAGIRLLIEEEIDPAVIVASLGITDDELARVNAAVEAERAERARVLKLLDEKAGEPDEARIKHLIQNDVADALIFELAGVDRAVLDAVNKAMEAEVAEKKRLAEEEAARKAAEAAGPPLEEIPNDEMLEYIESIREILEFSDVEKEIRAMCEQSNIPNCLVDIAVSEPDKLDELEAKAEG